MPKVLMDYLGFVFFFWSNEFSGKKLEPIHIHISRGKQEQNSTKIWIKPDGSLEVANNNSNLSQKELTLALEYIDANKNDIIAEWYKFFADFTSSQQIKTMELKDSATVTYSVEPQVVTVTILQDGAMDILNALAKMGLIKFME